MTRAIVAVMLILTTASFAAEPPAATRPISPEEAAYQAHVDLLEILLENPTNDELLDAGQYFRRREDHAKAAVFDLVALRGKPNDFLIEYELACNFALWGQKKLAAKYLTAAAEHGYWGWRVVAEDTDLDAIKDTPEFAAAVKKIEANFKTESPKHPPGMTVEAPQGNLPATGWPVMIFLHGWGSERSDFDEEAKFVATLGCVGVTLDATEVMGPGAYTWSRESVEPTHAQIQAALKKIKVKIDPKRVYLQGFSQGAMHAARLMADHPDSYRGVLCNSPGSEQLTPTALKDAANTGPIILTYGEHDFPFVQTNVRKIEALWKDAGRPVRVHDFQGGHAMPPMPAELFREALRLFKEGK